MKLRSGKRLSGFMYSKNNTLINKTSKTLPIELLRIIKNYHHCSKCEITDNKDKLYCDICERTKKLYIYRICEECDKDTSKSEFLINKNYFTHCEKCLKPLIKLVYCESFNVIDLNFSKYNYTIKKCNMCNIKTYIMNIYSEFL